MRAATAMRGKDVVLDGVSMVFGDFTAVHPTDLEIKAGEFFSILGPSGCGKTTILRMISGFLEPTTGRVLIGGDDMAGIGPNRRPTALIFQNLALFPLMPVWENVAFGLEARGVGKKQRRERAMELIDMVALRGQEEKLPGDLSGGQRQRVAIARALAVEPAVLLLDEPLSALDLKLRKEMQIELKRLQHETGITFIFVTHDQEEALTMSDRIAVMNNGRILQVGSPREIYDHPSERFVANFIGDTNLMEAEIISVSNGTARLRLPSGTETDADMPEGLDDAKKVTVVVRPEHARLAADAGEATLSGTLENIVYFGTDTHYHVRLDAGELFTIRAQNLRGRDETHESGSRIGIHLGDRAVQVLKD